MVKYFPQAFQDLVFANEPNLCRQPWRVPGAAPSEQELLLPRSYCYDYSYFVCVTITIIVTIVLIITMTIIIAIIIIAIITTIITIITIIISIVTISVLTSSWLPGRRP